MMFFLKNFLALKRFLMGMLYWIILLFSRHLHLCFNYADKLFCISVIMATFPTSLRTNPKKFCQFLLCCGDFFLFSVSTYTFQLFFICFIGISGGGGGSCCRNLSRISILFPFQRLFPVLPNRTYLVVFHMLWTLLSPQFLITLFYSRAGERDQLLLCAGHRGILHTYWRISV